MSDTIYRQDAIEFIEYLLSQPCKGHTGDFVEGMRDGYYRTLSVIKYLPSAQPHWIPCSERLPEEDEDVLVCDEDGVIDIACWMYEEWTDEPNIEWWSGGYRVDAVAWMPLPEPYVGDSDDKSR